MALATIDARHPNPKLQQRSTIATSYRPEPTQVPVLSVVIVNYCQWQETLDLVRQIRASREARDGLIEAVVVDNHSPYHPMIGKLRRWPGVSLRRWRHNRGFARAVNEGCRLSRGAWHLVLNPDVALEAGFLTRLLNLTNWLDRRHPRAGVVGFQLRNCDGTVQHSCGAFPTLPGTLARLALPRARRKYLRKSPPAIARVPWVTGCCLLLKADCWRQLGGLDTDFFLYYEDVDLCRRARAAGWSVWFEPDLKAVHSQPLHSRKVPDHLRLVTRHALLTYAAKHWPGWQFRLLGGVVFLESFARQLVALGRGQKQAAGCHGRLRRIVLDMLAGRWQTARRRLNREADYPHPNHSLPVGGGQRGEARLRRISPCRNRLS